jgi:hypothetical protein
VTSNGRAARKRAEPPGFLAIWGAGGAPAW